MKIHPSFRVRQLLNQLNLPARVTRKDRSCLGLLFSQVYRPPNLMPSTAEDKHPLMDFMTTWVLKIVLEASFSIATSLPSILQRVQESDA